MAKRALTAGAGGPDEDAAEIDLGGLGDRLGFHLRLASAAVAREFLTSLAGQDVTQKQLALLWLIETNPGVSQIALAQALFMDRATTMAIIDRLEGRALVVRRRSTVDRRRQELYLTPEGETFLAGCKRLSDAHEQALMDRLTPKELQTLRSALIKLYRE